MDQRLHYFDPFVGKYSFKLVWQTEKAQRNLVNISSLVIIEGGRVIKLKNRGSYRFPCLVDIKVTF